jgi:hypothetical protein
MNLNSIKKWAWVNKEGFLVGAVIAGILYYMKWDLPIKMPFDGISRLIVLIIILGGFGALIDSLYMPNK